jgi:UDP-N-acetylglucosamine 2-epimerase (non-hydrolysing)
MILIAYGTRPERIKVTPLMSKMRKLGIEFKVLHVGQHPSPEISDYYIPVLTNGNRLDSIIKSVSVAFSDMFHGSGITDVIVQGDTTTALAVAMCANHGGMRVIHLEAGLRTYDNDNPWPEEQNRRQISVLADVHLCPTPDNARNLVNDNVLGEIFITGNTAIDNLVDMNTSYNDIVLVTMHRRENILIMEDWFRAIDAVAMRHRELSFIWPLHPNPIIQKCADVLGWITPTKAMDHASFLNILTECKMVITDSGGLQEESSYFKKKCLVCRKVTERPESVGLSSFLVSSPDLLGELFDKHINDYIVRDESPYGEGNSSERICDILRGLYEK